ncbi:MAG: 30S ribosomal protein S4e [Candidatus Micrarchaeota archaeon]
MANKGNNRHLKRLAKSPMLAITPKTALWLIKPQAGPHSGSESMPLLIMLREVIRISDNLKETKRILSAGDVLVDGYPRREPKFGVGFMDIITIPKMKKSFQVFTIKGKLRLVEIPEADSKLKSCRIMGKTFVSGNKVQLNLHDGKNLLIEKEEDRFRVGDTVRITIPDYKVESFQKLEKGSNCYIFRGKHSGKLGTLEEIVEQPGGQPSDAKLKVAGEELITRKDYLFAVSKEFRLD